MRSPGGGRKSNNTGNQVSSLTRAVSPPDELLGDMAIDAWKRTCKILINRGTFEMADCYLLMEYCNTVPLLYDANQEIKSDGLDDDTAASGQKLGAPVTARCRYIIELSRLPVVLKMYPNSRILKKQPGDNDKSSGEFAEF